MGALDKVQWYLNRLVAMNPTEMLHHFQKKLGHLQDRVRLPDWKSVDPTSQKGAAYPALKNRDKFPEDQLEDLKWETWDIFQGNWKAFGWMDLRVSDPPDWHKDYFANISLPTNKWSSQLNHRNLEDGADIKLIWELSRWYQLVRLAQGAWLLKDTRLAELVLRWLQSWHRSNPPFRGWNWTSALESGIRLIQFAWMDALMAEVTWKDLDQRKTFQASWENLRQQILAPHVHYTWKFRSFGSSANNHLLGELSGLIIALTRWPSLTAFTVSLSQLKSMWETEVMAQFAEDGGNREQALNYQLFSFEFCWQVRQALKAADIPVRADVEDRLRAAAMFFRNMQVPDEPWDYGDSDSAIVTPMAHDHSRIVREWCDWLNVPEKSPAIHFWLGNPPAQPQRRCGEFIADHWLLYPESGMAMCHSDDWTLRWDLSPLGYLSIAAHGHLDALHLSIWYRGVAFVIDPGTGAYFGDRALREHLASRDAHNGPSVPAIKLARRLGPFMWTRHHSTPLVRVKGENSLLGQLSTQDGQIKRFINAMENPEGWIVVDRVIGAEDNKGIPFTVSWQFAPETEVTRESSRKFIISRRGEKIALEVSNSWEKVEVIQPPESIESKHPVPGVCSPAFRKVLHGPVVRLSGTGSESCQFESVFIPLAAE